MIAKLAAASMPLTVILALHLAAVPFAVIGLAADSREILGLNPWVKPLKFLLSSSTYMATVLALLALLDLPAVSTVVGWGVGLMMLIENLMISFQAARGQTSHFNESTPLSGAIFGVMGVAILVNTMLIAGLLAAFWITARPTIGLGLEWGVRIGLILFLAGSAEAVFMLTLSAHTVGAADGGPGLPFLNWSTRAGDLRVAHFVGLHGIHVLPVAGLLADRFAAYPLIAVLIVAGLYGGLFILLILQALAGKPLLP